LVKPLSRAFDFATWTQLVPESEIRRLLRFKVRYYFAGGKPGVLATEALSHTLVEFGKYCLQLIEEGESHRVIDLFNYCPTEGLKELRETLAHLLRERDGLDVDWEDVLITTGSQQAIYTILDVLLNPEDVVIIPRPAYLGFVNTALKFRAKLVTVPMTEQGVDPEHVKRAIRLSIEKFSKKPDLVYVIPDSDNPSGTTMPLKRREELFEVANDERILIVEDSAYREIQFCKERIPPIKSFDDDNSVVAYLRSSSKEAAVFRIGYSILPTELKKEVIKSKGYIDLNTPVVTQMLAKLYYQKYFPKHIEEVREGYKKRCDVMKRAIDEYFPDGNRTDPKGGFFIWWNASDVNFDSKRFLEEVALKNDVVYVPGVAFYPRFGYAYHPDRDTIEVMKPETHGMRLGYSYLCPKDILEGIRRLGLLLSKAL